MASTDLFGQMTESWQDENELPWARIRYATYRRNLLQQIGQKSLKVLDVGGGTGEDSVYFAKMGHQVTMIDCSENMLEKAKAAALEHGVLGQITFLHIEPESKLDMLESNTFDLILCNMMIEFVHDAEALLGRLCELLVAGGLLSIVDTNRYSDVYMQALQFNNLSEAAISVGLKIRYHPWVGREIPRYTVEDLIPLLKSSGCLVVEQYGILNLCAYLPNEPKFDPEYYQNLLKLEFELTDQYPYYLVAKFFQLIARKDQD